MSKPLWLATDVLFSAFEEIISADRELSACLSDQSSTTEETDRAAAEARAQCKRLAAHVEWYLRLRASPALTPLFEKLWSLPLPVALTQIDSLVEEQARHAAHYRRWHADRFPRAEALAHQSPITDAERREFSNLEVELKLAVREIRRAEWATDELRGLRQLLNASSVATDIRRAAQGNGTEALPPPNKESAVASYAEARAFVEKLGNLPEKDLITGVNRLSSKKVRREDIREARRELFPVRQGRPPLARS